MPRCIEEYAHLLGELIEREETEVYLINTGWSGGAYGVGQRTPLKYTRLMVDAALSGALSEVDYVKDDIFNLAIPTAVPGVPSELLHPEKSWKDPESYQETAKELAKRFKANFSRFPNVAQSIVGAGPF